MRIEDLIVETKKVKWRELEDLQPENLKKGFNSNKTKKSIIEMGFAQAIYVWQNPENNVIKIIDGHLRASLLKELVNDGVEVPEELSCTFLDNTKIKTEKEAIQYLLRVFNIKTNPLDLITLEDWLEDADLNFQEVAFDDLNIKMEDADFNTPEVEQVETAEQKEKDDKISEPAEKYTFVKKGDVWLLGRHRLVCGDSTNFDDVEKLMDGKKADMVFTDPPYNVNAQSRTHKKGILNDNTSHDIFCKNLQEWFGNIYIYMSSESCFYIWHNFHCQSDFFEYINMAGLKIKNQIIWVKDIPAYSNNLYRARHEICFYGFKDNEKIIKDAKDDTCWEIKSIQSAGSVGDDGKKWFDGGNKTLNLHVTQKPTELCIRALANSSNPNDIILDLFAGSGSTLIACEKTNRICYTMELDEHYCGVVINRYKDFTGTDENIFLLQDGEKIPYKNIVNNN